MTYIATFFSHFGAIKFKKLCEKQGIAAITMPVPRSLSSSCGICCRFDADGIDHLKPFPEELERVVLVENGTYRQLYHIDE